MPNKTQNYQLNQWVGSDPVLRTDFNEDNAKIDAALAAKADKSTVATLTNTVNTKADQTTFNQDQARQDSALAAISAQIPNLKTGTYTGTGVYDSDGKSSLTFPFRPNLVLLFYPSASSWNAICLPGKDGDARAFGQNAYPNYVTWSGNTVTWWSGNSADVQFNTMGKTYYYLAV